MPDGWSAPSFVPLVAGLTRLVVVAVFATWLAGCAGIANPVAITTTFDAERAALIDKAGSATIKGQAFVRVDGKVSRSVGGDVYLVPRTAYADDYFAQVFGARKARFGLPKVNNSDPDFKAFTRSAIADSGGHFVFDSVWKGDYYVLAEIPSVLGHDGWSYWIMERVDVPEKGSVRLIMRGY